MSFGELNYMFLYRKHCVCFELECNVLIPLSLCDGWNCKWGNLIQSKTFKIAKYKILPWELTAKGVWTLKQSLEKKGERPTDEYKLMDIWTIIIENI